MTTPAFLNADAAVIPTMKTCRLADGAEGGLKSGNCSDAI